MAQGFSRSRLRHRDHSGGVFVFQAARSSLGAERILAADRDGKHIAVEVKSFEGQSEVDDLEEALGQYLLYLPFLPVQEPDRLLYLAVPGEVWENIFAEPIGQGLLVEYNLRLLIFDSLKEVILQWMPIP